MPKNPYLAPVKRMVITLLMVLATATSAHAQLNKHYFFWAGRNLLMEDRFERAIETLNLLISTDDQLHEAFFLRGVAKYNLGDMIGAESDFGRAIELNPVYTMAYSSRAITRARIGNYADALSDFAAAIDLRPDISGAYFNRAIVYLQEERWQDAMNDLTRFIRRDDKSAAAFMMRGQAHLGLGDTLAARRDMDAAININRDSPEGFYRRGIIEAQQKRWIEALNDMQAAVDRDSTYVPALFTRALVHSELAQPKQAIEDLDRVIAIDDGVAAAWFNRAILKQQQGELKEALADYNAVAQRNPNNVLTYFNRANVQAQLGDFLSASADYSRAIELYPDFATAYRLRSEMRGRLGDLRGADNDQKTAERKIAEYRNKVADSTYSIYADPARDFSKLVAFDTRFARGTDDRPVNAAVAIMPMYRFVFASGGKRETARYQALEAFLQYAGADVRFTAEDSALPAEELMRIEGSDFRRAAAQALVKQYTASVNLFTKALDADPRNGFLYLGRAVARAEMIDFVSSLGNLYQMDDDPASRLRAAGERTYNYDEAINDMNKAVMLLPDFAEAHYDRGGLMVVSGRMPEAYDDYTRAIELRPDFAEAYFNRALVQIHMKDTRKGLLDLSKAGELGMTEAYALLKQYLEE